MSGRNFPSARSRVKRPADNGLLIPVKEINIVR
jgi:hypothetical protein